MSGLALIAEPEVEPAGLVQVDDILELLAHRGLDGRRRVSGSWYSLGHLHHWTTPEEVSEEQPLADSQAGLTLAFCGRIDNREELLGTLELAVSCSDAALVLAAFRRWGEGAFSRLLGPFALVIVQEASRRITCARDPVGGRGLYWNLTRGRLVVASEEVGVLSAIGTGAPRFNEDQLARLFAVTDLIPGETFLADVHEVEPGTALVFEGGRTSRRRFWDRPSLDPIELQDAEWEERFRDALDRAVAARLRSHLRPSALMSGGLDSTAVAGLAARRSERPLLTSSWVFDELPMADERETMTPAVERLGLEWAPLVADSLWPLRAPERWPCHPNGPLEGMFRWPRLHSYRDLRSRGAGVLLTGENGDHFFTRRDHWLEAAWKARRWSLVGRGISSIVRDTSTWGPAVSLRSSVGRAVGWRSRWRGWPARLTEETLERLPAQGPPRDPEQRAWRRLLDSWSQRGFAWESRHAALEGLEIRRPFRDRRVLELALTVPAHQLHRPPMTKSLLRRALKDLLPSAVVERTRLSSLSPLARRGIDEREAATVDRLLLSEDASWRRFVRAEWLFPGGRRLRIDEGHDGALVWACVTLEQWRGLLGCRKVWRGRPAELPSASPPSSHRAGDRAVDRVSPKALGET